MPFRLAGVVLFVASAVSSVAATCDDAVGQWAWFTKGVVTIKADGTVVHNPNNDGTWSCSNASRGMVTLKWRVGGFVNNMVLSADGHKLTSTDPGQTFVTGSKLGAAATGAKTGGSAPSPGDAAPAGTTPSAEPSRAAATGDLTVAYNAFLEGRRLAAAGRCRDAIPYFNQAIRGNPNDANAYSDRGRCIAMLGDVSQGLKDLDRAVKLRPNDMSPYYNRASLKADAGDGDGALVDLDWSVHLDPLNPASRAARAGLLMVAGRTEEGQLDLDTAYRQVDTLASRKRPIVDQVVKTWRAKSVRLTSVALPSGNPLEVAAAALKTGRYRTALAALDAALLKNPADDAALAMRARLRLDIGQPGQALADLNTFLQRHPNAYAYTDRGRALRQLARFREEKAEYDRAVRADPDYAPAYLERAFTTMNFVKGNDPSPDLTKVIQLEPQNWRAYYMRGQEYGYWNNKLHLAIADYRRVVELQPGFAQAYCDMAFALRELQRMNEVQGLLQKCYALDPSEREVTKKVFAKIKAGEEQAAREMAAMANYDPGGLDVNDPRVSQKLGAINSGQCSAAGGNWTGAYGCK